MCIQVLKMWDLPEWEHGSDPNYKKPEKLVRYFNGNENNWQRIWVFEWWFIRMLWDKKVYRYEETKEVIMICYIYDKKIFITYIR